VTGWPSTATEALAVAATTDAVSLQGLTILSPEGIAGDVACLEGAFTKPLAVTGVIEGDLVAASPALACEPLTNPEAIQGKIAFIDRGTCTFVKKLEHAFAAGAIAVVVADREESDVPFAMGGDGTEVDIPGVMIRLVDGDKIRAQLGQGVKVRMDPAKEFVTNISADQMAGFSSRGPRAIDNALKPEIGAPGVAIDAAGVGTGTGPRQLQGTSMASPWSPGPPPWCARRAHRSPPRRSRRR
jgi:minor extracellular serine protease Vpr